MSITLFGTCRIDGISGHNNLNNILNYTHSTKEVIQLIKFLKDDIEIPHPYNTLCFRTAIIDKNPMGRNPEISSEDSITLLDEHKNNFKNSDFFVIEISSNKKYIHKDYYLHHLCVDERFKWFNLKLPDQFMRELIVEKQDDSEIEKDILEIVRLLSPKKMLFVSHYNSVLNGSFIPQRNNIINLLEKICKRHNLDFVNPTELLSQYEQEKVITEDLGHYTEFGLEKVSELLTEIVKKKNNSNL